MQYPDQILPHTNYKKVQADLGELALCRYVKDKTLISQPIEIVSDELIGIEDGDAGVCFDYSTNLPGVFQLEHNQIIFISEKSSYFYKYWDWSSEVDVPEFQVDFSLDENIGWFFLPIKNIEGYAIPFKRNENKPLVETATAVVEHTPTNSNFWHFSVKWKDENGFISRNSSKWKNRLVAAIRAFLSELIDLNYTPQDIPDDWYLNN